MSTTDIREDIRAALAAIPYSDFLAATKDLLEVLGYQSDRTEELSGNVDDFIHEFPAQKPNTKTEQAFREHVQSVRIVFQITNDEIASANQQTFGFEATSFEEGRQQSVLFFTVELKEDNYPQGVYDEFTREIDKRSILPTVVFFRAGARLTVAVIGRRPHKLDDSRDVLERVTSLSKNIPLESPRRADLAVLSELSLSECAAWMEANVKPHNCEGLLAAWLAKLDTVERDQQFYRYTFDWFERAVFEGKFPEGEEQTLRLYFYDIAEATPLPREREAELADRIKNGDMRARDEMIQANLRFVISEAKKYQNRGLSLSDLISAGNLGLITAADRFDGTKGHKFITYAVWWIRQSILQTLAEHVRIVRLPLNKVSLLKDIAKASRKLSQERVSESDIEEIAAEPKVLAEDALEEIAAELEVPAKEILETTLSARAVCSLDEPFTDDERSLREILVDEATVPPDADILRESARIQLEAVLGVLEERESRIIRLYFGLDGNKALTLEEIGDMMNLTRERIRQLKDRALSKLRRRVCYQALKTLTTHPLGQPVERRGFYAEKDVADDTEGI